MTKWLECYLFYQPDAPFGKCFTVKFADASNREGVFKTNPDRVWYEKKYDQPPGAPFGTPGYVRVDMEIDNGHIAQINTGTQTTLGSRNSTVLLKKLQFVPPPVKTTQCLLRKVI